MRELECNIVLVGTLIKELACMYYSLTQQLYCGGQSPPF
jgi:hypothetical protein